MIVAKVQGKNLLVAEFSQLYPAYWQFNGAPPEDFMQANGLYKILESKTHDPSTHKLEQCAPYVEGGAVYGVRVVALTQEEIDAAAAAEAAAAEAAAAEAAAAEAAAAAAPQVTEEIPALSTAEIQNLSTAEVQNLTTAGL